MSEVNTFAEYNNLVSSARESFNSLATEQHKLFSDTFNIFIKFFRSFSGIVSPEEFPDSQTEHFLLVVIAALESVMVMFYTDESGFYETTYAHKRNYLELLLIAIAIGFDNQCYIDWKNERKSMHKPHHVGKRIKELPKIKEWTKELSQHVLTLWNKNSSIHSHKMKASSIKKHEEPFSFRLGVDIINEEYQGKRMEEKYKMICNLINLSLPFFDYENLVKTQADKFPEGKTLLKQYTDLMEQI